MPLPDHILCSLLSAPTDVKLRLTSDPDRPYVLEAAPSLTFHVRVKCPQGDVNTISIAGDFLEGSPDIVASNC